MSVTGRCELYNKFPKTKLPSTAYFRFPYFPVFITIYSYFSVHMALLHIYVMYTNTRKGFTYELVVVE